MTNEQTAELKAQGWREVDGVWTLLGEDGKSRSPNPADHERWLAAYLNPPVVEGAFTPIDDTPADDALVAAAKLLFITDAEKTGFKKTWDEATEGMRAHFIRLADKA